MFTGIVQHLGSVHSVSHHQAGLALIIDPKGWSYNPHIGDSIATDGVCLTLTEAFSNLAPLLPFDVHQETLSKTTLGSLIVGQPVHLEHALLASTPLGGHFVQGHVDATALVSHVSSDNQSWRLTITLSPQLFAYMIPKGSVTVQGVSLTIADLSKTEHTITLALIPTTLAKTTLGSLKPGHRVNIEADMLVKTIVTTLNNMQRP
jgi:riboflavin synthase